MAYTFLKVAADSSPREAGNTRKKWQEYVLDLMLEESPLSGKGSVTQDHSSFSMGLFTLSEYYLLVMAFHF